MKNFIKKPVVWLVAAVVVGGGLTPVWAESSSVTKLLASDISSSDAGLSNVEQVTNGNDSYIKANVRQDITKVLLLLPNNSRIEMTSFPNQSMTVALPASAIKEGQTVTLLAYVNTELVDTVKMKLADGTVSNDELVDANALYDQAAGKLKVSGIVNPKVDKVVVRYADKTSEALLVHVWEGAKSFEYSLSSGASDEKDAVVELYAEGKLLSEQKINVVKVNVPAEVTNPTATINGTAVLNAKNKQVVVKGSITYKNGDKKGKWKLVVTAPDGKKYEIRVSENGSFEAKLPFRNRSFSSKAVRLELYFNQTLVVKTDVAHGTPVNKPIKPANAEKKHDQYEEPGQKEEQGDHDEQKEHGEKHKDKEKHKDNGKHKGKKEGKHDDDDHDEDED